ncbi:DUF6143 family protein [Brevibacillus fortis]|uniref:Uncharacterized protein n=1 Tax=Brevibacillus fortis TaxID=2126352 RepID=A0A2P7UMZ9_9BACL|nr:DUF6143 family protein [Brevibacillus fortis]PSJ88285.1 hypothetical protein C7R93_25330 [Brevibacillus fortis]
MTKPSYTRPSYFYGGIPDVYMQMGYYPFPTPSATEQLNRSIHIPYAMSMADQCKYFMGQSEKMVVGDGAIGIAALSNPLRSGVHLFVNHWMITNPSPHPIEAHFLFGKASSLTGATLSRQVTSGYVQLPACPAAQGQLLYGAGMTDTFSDHIHTATRIIPASSTAEATPGGQWILGPGMALIVRVPHTGEKTSFYFSIDWWEQPVYG